jgi:hypothetical protein
VNITNPTSWLVKFNVLSCYIHLQVNITEQKFSKWRLPFCGRYTDKEISEIKINSVLNSVPKNTKILKQLFASGSVIIGEYSPRLRLGEYSPIIVNYWKSGPSSDHLKLLRVGLYTWLFYFFCIGVFYKWSQYLCWSEHCHMTTLWLAAHAQANHKNYLL